MLGESGTRAHDLIGELGRRQDRLDIEVGSYGFGVSIPGRLCVLKICDVVTNNIMHFMCPKDHDGDIEVSKDSGDHHCVRKII